MQVAIVVPLYNESRVLPGQLAHLRELMGRDPRTEVVLVDGRSDDETPLLLEESGLPWITAARGRAVQMNAGAAACGGDLLLFLHADTRLPAGALEAIRGAAADAPGGFFRVRLDSERRLLRLVGRAISLRSRVSGIATGDQALWFRRDVFERVGGFPELPLFEDVELCRRVREQGRMARLDATVRTSARRWERSGTWRTIFRMWLLRAGYALGIAPGRLARFYETAR